MTDDISPQNEAEELPAEAGVTDNATAENPLEDLEARCEKAEQEAKENYERLLRVCADFENYKKRSLKEMADYRKYANELLLTELLSIVDNLERAIQSTSNDDSASGCVIEGVEMTLKALHKIFEKFSVKFIDAVGKPFDPNFHQAMMQEASEDHPENTVIREFQKGYLLHDRLLRPSMVVVSKGAETPK
jgi:molecular chaperone GrpE